MDGSSNRGKSPSRGLQASVCTTAGSASIYFIVITAAFVLLTALLIDFARIAAFRKQAELSVKSGVRSTLSSFDPLIYAKYGLFIRGGESANELFRNTLEGNIAPEGTGAFRFLDTRWEETDVTESRPLGDHDVIRRQILEEMKYKAPIDLTLEVADRFRGVSVALKEATETVDLLEKMRKAYDRRESAFDEVLNAQKSAGAGIQQLLAEVTASQSSGDISTIADLAAQYDDYVNKRQEDEARAEAQRIRMEEKKGREENGEDTDEERADDEVEGPRYGAIITAYESGAISLSAVLSQRSTAIRAKSEKFGEQANAAYLRAKLVNDEMRAIVEQARSTAEDSSSAEVSAGEDNNGVGDQIQSLEQLRDMADDLVLDSVFFDQYAAEISLQQSQGLILANEAASFSSLAASVPGSTGMGAALRGGAARLQSMFSDFAQAYGPNGSICSERLMKLQRHRSKDSERKLEEQKAKTEWSGAMHFLGTLSGFSGSEEEKISFERTEGLYDNNREWNQTEEEQAKLERNGKPAEARDEAMSESSGLMNALEDSLLGTRDQLYFSEYSISRLSHFDPSLAKEMLHGGKPSLDIHLQEVEYILYGLNNPAGNIAAAYGEIFAFRLAIRTMEGLIESRALGHPLLVLAAALVYGIRNAMLDLNLLIEHGKVQLSKFIKVDTVYTDYLRLFLLGHGGSGNQMARTISVMEHASGLDFRRTYTYASGEGSASVRLWFFPGVLKAMGRLGDLGGTIKGNRYEATYTADISYQ
ncbi:hypothetical protein [Cohnella luojiensis]|uniref:Uncharacterized protein n=1 Tax=Cohnella luojiensis TaxID=652876 RepID=A0A4Y8M067_9BACL|nr:hypothetical protein [Cohnella luojiensis]TFE28200.1 hypothetical protein E2980_08265 [Cohnella luojiensis]